MNSQKSRNRVNPRICAVLILFNKALSDLDRIKFFDQIIPTIPFVNFSNSKNVLTKKLEELYVNEKNLFNNPNSNKDFINTVSAFITDNRVLVNIMNEFIVYKEQQRLQNDEFNQERLLALIIYKNLRPKDFSKLHKNKSNIDIFFSHKSKLIENSVKSISEDISEITNSITKIRQENIECIANLNTIFLYHIKETIKDISAKGLIVESEKKKFKELIDESVDLNVLYNEEIKWHATTGHEYELLKTFDEIDNLVGYKYSEKFDILVNEDKLIKEWA